MTVGAVPSLVGSADVPHLVQRPRFPETQEKCNRERSVQMLDLWHPLVDVTLQSLKGGTHAIWTPPQILGLSGRLPGLRASRVGAGRPRAPGAESGGGGGGGEERARRAR